VTTVLVVLLAPLVLGLLAVYAVLKLAVLMVRIFFLPVLWLANRPARQRVELRH
jgi:uncharacterized membrane protein (Fun14 family)